MSVEVIEQGATRWVRPEDYLPPPRKGYTYKSDNPVPSVPREGGSEDPRYPRPVRDKKAKFSRNSHKRTIGADARDARLRERNIERRLKKGFGTGLRDRAFPHTGRLPRLLLRNSVGRYLDLFDLYEQWVPANQAVSPANWVPSGWVVQHQCVPPGNPNAFRTQQNCGASVNCLSGQAGNGRSLPVYIVPGETRFTLITNTTTGTGFLRYQNNKWFIKSPCTGYATTTALWSGFDHVVHAPHPALNPNTMRRQPTIRTRDPRLNPRVGVGAKARPGTDPGLAPQPEPQPDPSGGKNGKVEQIARVWTTGGGKRNATPRGRQPPPKRDKERKVLAKSAQVAIAIFRALDNISESAEIVDAFYDALPASVRSKWDQKGRGLLDQAGQYGIDGADWKLQALFYNWHRIDFPKALQNVLWNEVEDGLAGRVFRSIKDAGIRQPIPLNFS